MYVYWEFVPDSGPTDRETPVLIRLLGTYSTPRSFDRSDFPWLTNITSSQCCGVYIYPRDMHFQ